MNRGRLARYSLWQFRDFAIDKGIAIVIIGTMLGYLAVEPIRRAFGPSWQTNPQFPLAMIVTSIAVPVISLAVFIAMNGIVSNDRRMGYYRFLFSKPVTPFLYYAQAFVVHLIGVLAAMGVLMLLFNSMVGAFPASRILAYALVVYLAMGGIGFLISAATRFDWVVLAGIWVGSRLLRAVYGDRPGIRGKLVELLPPVHRVDGVTDALLAGRTAPTYDLLWLVGYGMLCFVVGILVIRYRSLVD